MFKKILINKSLDGCLDDVFTLYFCSDKSQNSAIMKKSKIICIICFALLMVYGKAEPTDPPTGNEKIDLKGQLATSAGPDDVEAYVDSQAVYVYFNQNFGNVSVDLFNDTSGLIYSTVVNTSVQQLLVIPLSSAPSGTYTIELNTFFGHAEGEFGRE